MDTENTPYVRHPFERERTQTQIFGESMTHQSHADSCDINAIIRRYDNTGQLPAARLQPSYADVTNLQVDLTEAYNMSVNTLNAFNDWQQQRDDESKQQRDSEVADLKAKVKKLEENKPPLET